MTIEMERLSYSRLDMYRTCPRTFYKKYVEHAEPENSTTDHFAEFGSLVHSLYEAHSNAHGLIPKAALLDMYVNGSESRDGDIKGFNDIVFHPYFIRGRDTYYQQGLDTIDRLVLRNVSNVVGSEIEFHIKICDDIPEITGFIDQVKRDENGIKIVDFKSARPYTQEFCDNSLQLSIYAMAILDIFGELPYELEYEFFRFDEYRRTTRTLEQLELAKQEIVSIWDAIQREEFDAKYDDFFCQHFCSYNANCPLYQQKVAEKQQRKLAKQQKGQHK